MVGDNFLASTYRECFLLTEDEWFIKENLAFEKFCGSSYTSSNQNILSRLQISIAKAINEKIFLPKVIVMILHQDILEGLEKRSCELSASSMGTWLDWLATEVWAMIEKRKADLPNKAKKEMDPIIYWLPIPPSKQFKFAIRAIHAKFNNVLDSVIKKFDSMRVLKFKDHWNVEDSNLVNKNGNSLSKKGEFQLWKAMDASVQFNLKKREEFLNRDRRARVAANPSISATNQEDDMYKFFARRITNDQFHWSRSGQRREDSRCIIQDSSARKQLGGRFLLPRPK